MEINKLITVLLMSGLFVMGIFIPTLNPTIYYNRDINNAVTLRVLDNSSSNAQGQTPSLVNLFEEEEVETTQQVEKVFSINLVVHQIISFASPNLFFKEHFREVSGPPPWA